MPYARIIVAPAATIANKAEAALAMNICFIFDSPRISASFLPTLFASDTWFSMKRAR
jgi:hypothetical protein